MLFVFCFFVACFCLFVVWFFYVCLSALFPQGEVGAPGAKGEAGAKGEGVS